MSTDDGLRHRIPNTIESSSDAPSTSPISNDDDARQQPDRDEAMIETAVFHLQNTTDQPPLPDATLQVRQLRFHELMNEAFANFRTILSAFNQTLTAPVRLAFGRNTLQIGTAGNGTHGLEWGVAFEGNNWNEREVLDEFVNPNPSQIHNFRQRMFRTIFTKIVLIFVLTLPSRVRKMFEYSLLIAAIICLFTLTYLHVVFVRRPRNCLEAVPVNWTTDGILRLEIMPKADQLALYGQSLIALDHLSVKPTTQTSSIRSKETFVHEDFDRSNYSSVFERIGALSGNQQIDLHKTTFENNQTIDRQREKYSESDTQPSSGSRLAFGNEQYAVEFSVEHGFLRLSSKTREKLNIPTKVLLLDPDEEKCFGDSFSRFLLKYFFGYNDILMNSLKYLAEKENSRGYVYNVITGEHYRFVNVWMTRTSYIAAAFIMLVFTLTISMLLRYSHHQVFVFVAQLTQLLEFNTPISFPFAPLLTVILALIGMEAIMTEFFNDSGTAFYIILIVWTADQYDWFCCHTSVTRRNWLKFFYLYHFAFYAYVYRFSGQYADLALLTSWLFILHSMVYFFHRYELPYILSQSGRITVTAEMNQTTVVSQLTMNERTVSMRILLSVDPIGNSNAAEMIAQDSLPSLPPEPTLQPPIEQSID